MYTKTVSSQAIHRHAKPTQYIGKTQQKWKLLQNIHLSLVKSTTPAAQKYIHGMVQLKGNRVITVMWRLNNIIYIVNKLH